MKKTISAILILAVATTLFSSCAADGPQLLDFIGNTEEFTADFGGDTITFGLRSFEEADMIIPGDSNNALEADEQREKISRIEKTLHCVIEQQLQEDSSMIAAAIAGQATKTDIYFGASYEHMNWYRTGLLYDYNEIDAVDLSDTEKWGSKDRQNIMSYQGAIFGVYPKPQVIPEGSAGIVLVNDKLIQSYNQPTPKELLENGNWTFDYFTDYVVAVSDMRTDPPTYGMTIVWGQEFTFPLTAIFANGSSILSTNENGKHQFNLANDQKARTALEWSAEVYRTGVITEDDYGTASWAGMFANGQSAMWVGSSGVGLTINQSEAPLTLMSDGFSFINFPYGPDAVYGETPSTYYVASMSYAIPISSDPDDMGLFINEFCTSYLTEDEIASKIEDYRDQFFYHPEDYDTVYRAGETAMYTYFNSELFDVQTDISEALNEILKGKKNVTEAFTSITPRVMDAIEDFE